MSPKEFSSIARRLMAVPTAPFFEHAVREVVEEIARENGLNTKRDRFGNVIVRLGDARAGRPLVLAAHMDHPGFEIVRRLDPRRWLARFSGGVPDAYFLRGTGVRLEPGGARARLGRRAGTGKLFKIELPP
jgi:putative aminopeptidase FrvX